MAVVLSVLSTDLDDFQIAKASGRLLAQLKKEVDPDAALCRVKADQNAKSAYVDIIGPDYLNFNNRWCCFTICGKPLRVPWSKPTHFCQTAK